MKNSFLATILLFLIFISCAEVSTDINEELKFNYSTFETYKSLNLSIRIPSSITSLDNETLRYEQTLDIINSELGSNLSLTELDNQILNNNFPEKSIDENYEDFLNSTDIELLQKFEK